ncbi:alpha/beta hydrolase family protein [candidate division KSB1 bacterium]
MTKGAGDENEIRFRYIDTDPEEFFIDMSKPVNLSAYGEWTKKEGFYELAGDELKELIFMDKHFGRLRKAKNSDTFLYTIETFREFPDYYVSDMKFTQPKRLTDAVPFQSQYKWGYRILFDFQNSQGIRLQGTLAVPDGYRQGSKLPMIVNFYEKKSQELHYYYSPQFLISYRSGNIGPVSEFGAFVSNDYLVMQLDVHFNTGTTHDDMLDCVTAAVKKVIEMGYADPDRVALCGGSFSGGGSAFIATRSDMFACIASRAAPINLAGEFNILFSGSGQNNHSYDIYGQGRYGTDPFHDFELYRSQSPITHVENMNTPLLYLHGKQDGSVEYLQGMEFYNALRFLGKPVIFLSYPEEGHNLKKLENQVDFTKRLWAFFDHYLKDKPAPDWMIRGIPHLEKKK